MITPKKTRVSSELDKALRHNARRKLAPGLQWSKMSASEHFVQFYETDEFLLDSVSGFIGAGLGAGAACIVLATKAHREGLEERLKVNGLDVDAAYTRGKYLSLDAGETLSTFMVDGLPDPERFAEVVGSLIERVVKGQRCVRIFGEMVAQLWTEGNQAAAVRLEALWNELHPATHPFSLFCAYPMHGFAGEGYGEQFTEICQQHSHAIPDESYTLLASPDERLRAITLLQQKAASLESEIAERKAAEERLRISENRYRRLFEASTNGILIVDPLTGTITDANPFMTEMLGYAHEQLLGQQLWHIGLFQDREANLEVLRELQEKRFLRYETLSLHTKDRRYVEFVSTLFQANGHEIIQCNIRDITAQKELEQQREAFVSMVTHELKTPLTALQGNVQLAQRRLTRLLSQAEQLPPEQRHALEEVLTMLSRSQQQLRIENRLINDLLDVAHIQEDKLELRLAPCDLVRLVYETVQDYQAAYPSRLITLELSEHDPLQVSADRDRLRQVLGNYLTNALKFSPNTESVHVGLSLEAGNIRVWVQDHGPGLSPEQQQHIWKRFYQAPRTPIQSGSKAGLGLGLYICQQLISRQQGQVGIESIPGEGATFWFTLPLLSSPSHSPEAGQ